MLVALKINTNSFTSNSVTDKNFQINFLLGNSHFSYALIQKICFAWEFGYTN